MINPQALETFGKYDKKSLMAGVVVGQGLKGRARAPQTPAPAGFPQGLWDDAAERANAMIASLQGAGQSGETQEPETPSDWQFDKDAFCFGIAAGRSLEGWEIDGGANLFNCAKIMYYVHLDNPDTLHVSFHIGVKETWHDYSVNYDTIYADWGDGTSVEALTDGVVVDKMPNSEIICFSHVYPIGDYIITLISKKQMCPSGKRYSINDISGVYGGSDNTEALRGIFFGGNVNVSAGICAFNRCSNLTNVTMLDNMTAISEYAFANCSSLTSVTIPNSVKTVWQGAFQNCTSLISAEVFFNQRGGTILGAHMFSGCINLTNVTLGNDFISIPDGMFENCKSLKNFVIPNGVKILRTGFKNCVSLTGIIIPDGVRYISAREFSGCFSLTSVAIPESVEVIGQEAFEGCTGLTDVYYSGTKAQWEALLDAHPNSLPSYNLTRYATIHYNSTGPDDVHDD